MYGIQNIAGHTQLQEVHACSRILKRVTSQDMESGSDSDNSSQWVMLSDEDFNVSGEGTAAAATVGDESNNATSAMCSEDDTACIEGIIAAGKSVSEYVKAANLTIEDINDRTLQHIAHVISGTTPCGETLARDTPIRVEEGLWLGANGAVNGKDLMKRFNITHVLTLRCPSSIPYTLHTNDFVYKSIQVVGDGVTSMDESLDECFNYIDEAISAGGTVLLHFFVNLFGVPTVPDVVSYLVAAYIMLKHALSRKQALSHIRSIWPSAWLEAELNPIFLSKLNIFERSVPAGVATDQSVCKAFRLGRKIGSGLFGDIFIGTYVQTNEEVALKFVHKTVSLLQYEMEMYSILKGGAGIPAVRWFGVEGEYEVMAMDLLGPSLENLFNFFYKSLSLKTVLLLAVQMISLVEFVHSRSLILGDVKLDSFLMGSGRHAGEVYAIDFGCAKKYMDVTTNLHISYSENKPLTRNARYASVNAHLGIEQSRRDDMESLGYLFMYLLKGRLPWQGLKVGSLEEKFAKIAQMKFETSLDELCEGYPAELKTYLHHCRSLQFDEKPNYDYLKGILWELLYREGSELDYVYEWNRFCYQQFPRAARVKPISSNSSQPFTLPNFIDSL